MGYVLGKFPPGKKDIALADKVLQNLLKAHCDVYYLLKVFPEGRRASIGIVHNVLKFEPYYWWNPIEHFSCYYLSHMTNDVVLNFFKTGEYKFYIPFYANSTFIDKEATGALDFIGLNYYSHPLIKMQFSAKELLHSACYEDEKMGDKNFRLYPEGLYKAIKDFSILNVPIYITENGIPDKDDVIREDYIKRYLFSLSEAIKDGYDVRGYYYWTLMDNFEWDEGYLVKFGLYEVDFADNTKKLREGSKIYLKIIDNWKRMHNYSW